MVEISCSYVNCRTFLRLSFELKKLKTTQAYSRRHFAEKINIIFFTTKSARELKLKPFDSELKNISDCCNILLQKLIFDNYFSSKNKENY